MDVNPEVRRAFDEVRAAIERIGDAKNKHLEMESDPTADSDDCGAAREAFREAERCFGNQWQSVEVILSYMNRIVCSYCGHATNVAGMSDAERASALLDHIIGCEKRPELKFVNVGLAAEEALEKFANDDMEAFGKAMANLRAELDRLKVKPVEAKA